MSRHVDELTVNLSPDDAIWAGRTAVGRLGWKTAASPPSRIVVEFARSPFRWESRIEILFAQAEGQTTVTLNGWIAMTQKAVLRKQMKQLRSAIEDAAAPQDATAAWLTGVASTLAARFGLREHARNTGTQIKGVPIEGDVRLDGQLTVSVALLADEQLAQKAEQALKAEPETASRISEGRSAIRTAGRVLCVAHGQSDGVDQSLFDDVVRTVGESSLDVPVAEPAPELPISHEEPRSDPLEQLHRLAELRDAGVLTDAEFEAKKAELLNRI